MHFWWILVKYLSILKTISQFFPQLFYNFFFQFNYLLNYFWKSIVKSIIFSIIAWCGLVEPSFESSLNPSLDSEGKCEGLSRVWTQAKNLPIRGSVSDPCPCLEQTWPYQVCETVGTVAPAEGLGLGPRLLLPFGKKEEIFYTVLTYLCNFWW